jgi:hypothetical protein
VGCYGIHTGACGRWRSGQRGWLVTGVDVLARALQDPAVKAECGRLGPIYALVFELVEARHRAGLPTRGSPNGCG